MKLCPITNQPDAQEPAQHRMCNDGRHADENPCCWDCCFTCQAECAHPSEADTARLNWMQELAAKEHGLHGGGHTWNVVTRQRGGVILCSVPRTGDDQMTIREAIDIAMNAEQREAACQ